MEQIIKFIDIIKGWLPFVSQAAGVKEDIEWGLERVKAMVAETRDPSAEEWDEVNQRTAALQTKLHSDDA